MAAGGESSYSGFPSDPNLTAAQLLHNYSTIACFDSTHNTCFSALGREEKAYLYSVVIKNLNTGAGAPAAFMVTASEAQYAIADFLGWLRSELKFPCKKWMIDCSNTEVAGIYKGIGSDATIYFCHVMDKIVNHVKTKLSVRDVALPLPCPLPLTTPCTCRLGSLRRTRLLRTRASAIVLSTTSRTLHMRAQLPSSRRSGPITSTGMVNMQLGSPIFKTNGGPVGSDGQWHGNRRVTRLDL
jgi:hypothetical protein